MYRRQKKEPPEAPALRLAASVLARQLLGVLGVALIAVAVDDDDDSRLICRNGIDNLDNLDGDFDNRNNSYQRLRQFETYRIDQASSGLINSILLTIRVYTKR